MHVSTTENSEEASFFESFEAAHSSHDLSSSIAKVLCSLFSSINNIIVVYSFKFLVLKYLFVDRNLVSKHHRLESTAKLSMGHCPEEMELYICDSLIKDTVRKYGIMPLGALL